MNKFLLGTTALAVAAAFTVPAMAAEHLQLHLRGYHIGSISYTDGDESISYRNYDGGTLYGSGNTGNILGDYNKTNFGSDSEVHFIGSTTLDNGLEVTFHAELELEDDGAAKDNPDNIDEVYVQFDGGFGRVQFGQQDGVIDQTHVHEPSTFAGHAVNDVSRGNQDPFRPLENPNLIQTTGDFTTDWIKIIYFTPSMNGLQLGVSYTPNPCRNAAGYAGCVYEDFGRNYWEVSGTFETDVNNIGLELSAGYGQGESGGASEKPQELSLGANVSFGGFTVGGAYGDRNTIGDSTYDRTDWSAGVTYETGPWGFNLNYARMDSDSSSLCTGCASMYAGPASGLIGIVENHRTYESEAESWLAGITYKYGPGMQIGLGVQTLDTNSSIRNTYFDPYPDTKTGFVDYSERGFEGTSVFIENSMTF